MGTSEAVVAVYTWDTDTLTLFEMTFYHRKEQRVWGVHYFSSILYNGSKQCGGAGKVVVCGDTGKVVAYKQWGAWYNQIMRSLCDVTCRHTLHVASRHNSCCADLLVDTYVTEVRKLRGSG